MFSLTTLKSACYLLAVQISEVPGTTAASEAGGGSGDGTAAAPGDGGFSFLTFLPMMLAVLVIYFMFMPKPGAKENAQSKEMLENLKKNDRIVTAGGILGTVVSVRDEADFLTIRVDENTNTKMQILKRSVIRVLKDDEKDV